MIDWNSVRRHALPLPLRSALGATSILTGIGYLVALLRLYLTFSLKARRRSSARS